MSDTLSPYGRCTDSNYFEYDATATVLDASACDRQKHYGCTDASAANFATTTLGDPVANVDDGSCILQGCTDPEAANYDSTATFEDASCAYTNIKGCMDPAFADYLAVANVAGPCKRPGCTDPTSVVYSSLATYDDGSCLTAIEV